MKRTVYSAILQVSQLGLHDNFPGHLGVHPAEERIFSRRVEAELELVLRVECIRFEFAICAIDGMWDIVFVDPGHLRAGFYCYDCGIEDKVIDLNFAGPRHPG